MPNASSILGMTEACGGLSALPDHDTMTQPALQPSSPMKQGSGIGGANRNDIAGVRRLVDQVIPRCQVKFVIGG